MTDLNLGVRFERMARKHPCRLAVVWLDWHTGLTYEKCNRVANQTARFLLEQGVVAGDVVSLPGVKCLNAFLVLLGCLKIGAPYVVLDPYAPAERRRRILESCQPKFSFDRDLLEVLRFVVREYDDRNLGEAVYGASPAYIMYTSGSTGFPKGAVMTHANVLRFIDWSVRTFGITSADILTNVNPLYFDNSVFDFYAALFSGATLAPIPRFLVSRPRMLLDAVDRTRCTLWFSVPSLLIYLQTVRALSRDRMESVSRFVFGGEGYPKTKLKELFELYGDRAEFFNVYGPTECTCMCSAYKVVAEDFDDVKGLPPLGKLAGHFRGLVLSADGREVEQGEMGELCLLGPGVGLGYYRDPERTSQSFVLRPEDDGVMYRTGDLVYEDVKGKLHFVGREDSQIKHMGYRIELGEIETALNCIECVDEATVFHGSARGLSQIVAVVASPSPGIAVLDLVRQGLADLLPQYMMPTHLHVLPDALPKNPNGKIDRRGLRKRYVE